jgi:C4-dicarboxylate-specific signal transduction histidine kinase
VVNMDTNIREVAFFGKMTASFTHEMRNVLAIIRESAGLMEDLLSLSQNDTFPHKERFVRSLSTIETQAKRGIELSGRLNRFAHSTDVTEATLDLNQTLEEILFLSERFARLKGVTLSLIPNAKSLPAVASPIALHMAVFSCLECCWDHMAAGGNISLSVGWKGQEAIVSFVCQSAAGAAEDHSGWFYNSEAGQAIQKTVKSLSYRVECSAPGSGLVLILPPGS